MDTVKIDLKVFARSANGSGEIDPGKLIPIFHRWIQEQVLDELMIDVADYSHVPDGPSIILLCHDAQYGLDRSGGDLGLLYSRRRETRASVAGIDSLSSRLLSVFSAALEACARLESEPALGGRLSFPADRFRLTVNDRLYGAESVDLLQGELRALAEKLFPESSGMEIEASSEDRVCLDLRLAQSIGSSALLGRLHELAGKA